ncbi:MAG: GNAT family N-acetyltransferase [Ruminococcaceae bacterium]|nr:GNAT family N-acetyltransferase [Oscillospiraceae bacterium]
MDYLSLTQAYYSAWIGRENVISDSPAGIIFVESEERNKTQYGYSDPIDLWLLQTGDRTFVSFGKKVKGKMEALRSALRPGMTAAEMVPVLTDVLGKAPYHGVKYVYAGSQNTSTRAVVLPPEDGALFLAFQNVLYPPENEEENSWALEYFNEISAMGYCCGVIEDGILVSCTDAPGMPYMSDTIQEIGINTLPAYRKKGYAADACLLAISQILKSGKCPIWATGIDNLPSQRLAETIGFRVFGETLTLTL